MTEKSKESHFSIQLKLNRENCELFTWGQRHITDV